MKFHDADVEDMLDANRASPPPQPTPALRDLLQKYDRPRVMHDEAVTEAEELVALEPVGFSSLEDTDLDDPAVYPLVPQVDTAPREFEDRFVDYATRGPRDVVLSGPVIGGWGPGRYFQNRRQAREAMQAKYGARRVQETEGQTRGRWSFLIKNLKKEGARCDEVSSRPC